MEYYIGVLKKYAEFNGRARRKEYWMFVLFNIVIAMGLGVVDGILSAILDNQVNPFGGLYSLAILLPSIAVAVRRLHDTGRSGWNYFIVLIPIVGAILMIIWLVKEGDVGPNQYGADPKAVEGVQPVYGAAAVAAPPVAPMPVTPPPLPVAAAPAPAPQPSPTTAPAGWVTDPSGRHELRYWDGTAWTSHVSDQGVTSSDPV